MQISTRTASKLSTRESRSCLSTVPSSVITALYRISSNLIFILRRVTKKYRPKMYLTMKYSSLPITYSFSGFPVRQASSSTTSALHVRDF